MALVDCRMAVKDVSAQFRALLEAAPDAMVIIDRTGTILHVNAQTEKLFGYPRGELLGKPVEVLVPARFREQHPGYREGYFQEPRPRPMGAPGLELCGLRRDGTEFPAEISLGPLDLDSQHLVIAAIRDGTAHRRVEKKFRDLLEAAPDAMIISDSAGRMVLVNAQTARLFGYSKSELLGQPVEMLIPPRYRGGHVSHRRGYFDEPRVRPMGAGGLALFGLRKDQSEFPAEISLSPLRTEEEVLSIAAIRDVTGRRMAEEERAKLVQAQEALRMRDEFLSIASHELKTPLTPLKMQVDSILLAARKQSGDLVPARMLRRVEMMGQSVRRLNTLIDQLLDLSRISAGRLTLEPEETDLSALVADAVAQFQDELERAGCPLSLRADEPVVGVWDPLRLEQVVTNLVSNAIKYGEAKPIEVTVGQEGTTARLVVRDHGMGIAPEDQARIFQRFERIVPERHIGGFGLGLWIVQQIVQAHGGTIGVWSKPGAGSSFTVDLPLVADQTAPTAMPAPGKADARVVMLVDDDALLRSTFQEALEEEGVRTLVAANGLEALKLLRAGAQPQVIFLDVLMPIMDAPAFQAELQKDPALGSIPVVAISAVPDVEKRASALGAVAHLKKPLELARVLPLVRRYCG